MRVGMPLLSLPIRVATGLLRRTTRRQQDSGAMALPAEPKYAIYRLACQRCRAFYIGYTSKPVRARVKDHCRSAKRAAATPLAQHIREHGEPAWRILTRLDDEIAALKATQAQIRRYRGSRHSLNI